MTLGISNSSNPDSSNIDQLSIIPPVVLVVDASDPTCGSGIYASAISISAIGCHSALITSALAIQDTVGLSEIHSIAPEIILRQARAILEDMPISAIKVGMPGNYDCVRILGEIFSDYREVPLILDPTFTSKAGEDLVSDEILETLVQDLISQATVLTTNIKDAQRLSSIIKQKDFSNANSDICGSVLIETGCEFVLITDIIDNAKRIERKLYHKDHNKNYMIQSIRLVEDFYGAGSTFSSALSSYLAHGIEMNISVKLSNEFTNNSLSNSLRLGMGRLIPNRMYWRDQKISLPFNPIGDQIYLENKLEKNYPGN